MEKELIPSQSMPDKREHSESRRNRTEYGLVSEMDKKAIEQQLGYHSNS